MKKIFYGWWVVSASFIIGLYVSGVVFYGFTAFFEPLVNEFGWSYAQISFAASLRGLEMGILAFPIGFLTDRFGSRKVMFSGVISVGFGLLILTPEHHGCPGGHGALDLDGRRPYSHFRHRLHT